MKAVIAPLVVQSARASPTPKTVPAPPSFSRVSESSSIVATSAGMMPVMRSVSAVISDGLMIIVAAPRTTSSAAGIARNE